MPTIGRRAALGALGAGFAASACGAPPTSTAPGGTPGAARRAEPLSMKFTLDWLVQGPAAPFIFTLDKGYFTEQGLNVTIDRGYGSADAVTKIASGAYDIGFGDINSMMEFNVKNPGKELIAIAMIYDVAPLTIMSLKKTNIKTAKDLEGKTMGEPAGGAGRRLFPLFAKATKIDAGKVKWVTMEPALRETVLIKGDVDAIGGFTFTSLLNLKAAGIPEADVASLPYAANGVDVYGNAIMAPPAYLEKNADGVRDFLRAFMRGWKETIARPDDAIAVLKRRDPLFDAAVEKERLAIAIKDNMVTPDARANGLGAVKADRLARSIGQVAEGFELSPAPRPEQVFTDKYLPPSAERRLPA